MKSPSLLAAAFFICFAFCANAQFTVERGLTFGKAAKHEQTLKSVKLTDLSQGPFLVSHGKDLPETPIYKRALVYRRVVKADTIEIVYSGESAVGTPDDKSKVTEGKYVWRPYDKQTLLATRDSLLRSLDGTPRTFVSSKKKLKKGLVTYKYIWTDASYVPTVVIDYGEKKRMPTYLRMTITYNRPE